MKNTVLILVLFSFMGCLCRDEVKERVSNADGSYQALISEHDCGATDGIVTSVSIRRKYLGLFSGDPDEIFVAETPFPLSVTWVDSKHLLIEYRYGEFGPLADTRIKIGTKRDRVGPIRVTCREADTVTPTLLEDAAAALRKAVLDRHDNQVLAMMSEDGVEFGPDSHLVSLDEIRVDFQLRGSMYCTFFDGDGLRAKDRIARTKAGAGEREVSLRSMLEQLSDPGVRLEVRDGGAKTGMLRVVTPTQTDAPTLELGMTLQETGWKITSMPTW